MDVRQGPRRTPRPRLIPPSRRSSRPRTRKSRTPRPRWTICWGWTEQEQDPSADEAAQREIDEELQRELAEAQILDAFRLAVEKMQISADLLDVRFDPGLGTQRVQEDIIAKLQQIIDQAKKQNQGSSSSSSSSSQPPEDKQDPGKQDKQQQQPSESRNDRPQESGEGDPPGRQDGDLNTIIDETRQEWGQSARAYSQHAHSGGATIRRPRCTNA